ncbi:AGAMOUS-like 80, putative [Theobroma cacao]|uniref:AGAMOUS-like 80, putative n=1 Tax=Theobroma cacao TaxID=3641 RepID=A0A061F0V0_THECC|nr:AGAMOUS-like 80, putative [Theobroma cacao]
MTRKKVKLSYITKDSARKSTFKKGKKGLLKKASELSTLCGIEGFMIIYNPYDAQLEQRIEQANKQLKRQCRDNREKETTQVMFQCLAKQGLEILNVTDLSDLGWLLEQNLKDIDKKIYTLAKPSHSQSFAPAASTTMATPETMLKSGGKV